MSTLLEQIKQVDLGNVAIFSGAGVDPDGLASSLAMKMIVESFGGNAQCFYRGSFNRPQNKTVREVLALSLKGVDETDFNADCGYTLYISVDGPGEVCPMWPDFIIDHHKPGKEASKGTDVREIGSASAILWEYCMAAGIDFEDEKGKKLATALAVGILTDTNNFKIPQCAELDFKAAAHCLQNKDYKTFLAIQNWSKPAYYHDLYSIGWESKIMTGTVLVAPLGPIPSGRAGIISDLAEKFGETDGINLCAVVAMVNSQIIMSVRISNSSIGVKDFVKIFGGGGGKDGAGVAIIDMPEPLFSNVNDEDRKRVFNSFFSIIVDKALEFAGDGARPERQLIDKEQ